jgi:DDE superfamily endonuclease
MKTIVHRCAAIVTFLSLVGVSLNAPQLRHLERFADLLVTAPRRKTLAQLAAQELDGVDPSNLADFFRISPWDPDDVRLPLIEFILRYLQRHPQLHGLPLYFTLDDSLTPKDKGTHKLQGIDWHFDHNQKRTIKGGCHVVLGLHWGDFHFPLTWRPYLRQTTVRRLNKDKRRRNKPRLRYRSKLDLAQEMLQQVIPLLPPAHPVYVLFDSWYTSAKLVKWIRQQGWHVIGAVKSNRKVSGQKLTAWHRAFKGHSYGRVSLELANKQRRTYWTRTLLGRIRGVPSMVRVVISQRGPGVRTPKYFLCTDATLSAQEILTRYQKRWSQEVDYWYVKMQLGLGDYRLHSYEAITKWYAVVYLVLVYLYWQRYEHESRHKASTSLSEVLARLRQDHQREVLRAACEEVARGATVAEVVERYVGPMTVPAA